MDDLLSKIRRLVPSRQDISSTLPVLKQLLNEDERVQRLRLTPAREYFLPTSQDFRKNLANLGQLIQQIPSPKLKENIRVAEEFEERGKQKGGLLGEFEKQQAAKIRFGTALTEKTGGFVLDAFKDTGRTFEKLGKGEKLGFWDYLNLTDFMPGIGFVGGGVRAVGKEGLEKVSKEAVEETGENIIKQIPKKLEPMVEVAKKYKSAEDFRLNSAVEMTKPEMKDALDYASRYGFDPTEFYNNVTQSGKGVVKAGLYEDAPKITRDAIEAWQNGVNIGAKRFGLVNEYLAKKGLKLGAIGEDLQPLAQASKGVTTEKIVKESGEDVAQKALRKLLTYENQLRHLGFTKEETKYINSNLGEKIINSIHSAEDVLRYKNAVKKNKLGLLPKEDIKLFEKIVDLENEGEIFIDPKVRANIFDRLRTPEFVLEKVGLKDEARLLRTSWDTYKKELRNEIQRVRDWRAKVPSKESSQKIFQYLDGQMVFLDKDEQIVANEIKSYLSAWADRLKLPKENRISDYITHIWADTNLKYGEFPEEIAKIIQDKIPTSIYNPFTQKRIGNKGYVEDVWLALDAYVKRSTRQVNMTPALKQVEKSAKNLDLYTYNYIKDYGQRINLRPTEVDVGLDNAIKSVVGGRFGQRPTNSLTQGIRGTIFRATLGGNLGSALRNLQQGINTYSILGEKNTVLGYADLIRKGLTRDLDELYRYGVLDDNLIQDRHFHVIRGLAQKLDSTLFAFFDTAEKINRGSAYFGAKRQALAKGMNESQAVQYALDVVRKTQFKFDAIDTPLALSSDLAKTFTQFMSFPMKQTEFLVNLIKDKNTMGLLRYIAGSYVMYSTIGKVLGVEPTEYLPFSDIFKGEKERRLPQPPVLQLGENILDIITADEKERMEVAGQKLPKLFALLFPGGSQIKKSFEGYETGKRGGSFTKTGEMRFPIDSQHNLQALLFGQYSVPQAKQYFKEGAIPLGLKQTEVVKKYGPEAYGIILNLRKVESKVTDDVLENVRKSEMYKNLDKEAQALVEKRVKQRISARFNSL